MAIEKKAIGHDAIHKAKQELVKRIWSEPDSELWTLVDLVNELQQQAIDSGLWSFPEPEAEVRKSEVLATKPQEGDLCWDVNRAIGMKWCDGTWEDVEYSYWVKHHEERS